MKIRMHGESLTCWCEPARLHRFADGRLLLLHRMSNGAWPDLLYQITAIALEAFGDPRDAGDVLLDWDMEEHPDAYA